MKLFQPHQEILPQAQQELWPQLRPAAGLGFVLYGGTAIALQLGHRQSIDFDFFSERKLEKEKLWEAFPFLKNSTLLQDRENSLTVEVRENEPVKVSFFGGLTFGRVGEPLQTNDGVLQVASLDDLMATKLKVIFQRVEAKDYLDIAAMIKAGVSLSKGLAAAATMFGSAFQPSESLKALTYFHGGDLQQLSSEIKEALIKAANAVRNLPQVELRARVLASVEEC
ncbi:MAG: nucleotidyl transferase AbiEii/AbiGii toxin family protein [Chthoniobacterales bacterium]